MAVKRRVGIIGALADEHAGHVAAAVKRAGGSPVRLDPAAVPERCAIRWEDGRLSVDGDSLDDVRAYYLKSVPLSIPAIDPEALPHRAFERWQDRLVAERERQSFLGSVLRELSARAYCVNPVETFDLHFLKLHQAGRLARAGVPTPPTLGTCDPEPAALRAFAAKHREIVVKPLAGGALVEVLGERDLDPERTPSLRRAPALFQARIVGREFRVYVLAGEPLAAFEIDVQGVADARQALATARRADLPAEGWAVAAAAARALGLVFTAVDLRWRVADRAWFVLEANPAPAIAFHDDPRDGRVVRALAAHLVAHA